jgi:hypothetical protein
MFTTMPRPDAATKALLDSFVLDERTARTRIGSPGHRGSADDWSGRTYAGRPRVGHPRRRTAESRFDANHLWKGDR